jgi:hypothetical protein
MKSSTFGEQNLIAEANALIDGSVAVDLLDLTVNSTAAMGAIRNRAIVESLVSALPDADLVIPLMEESGLVALAVDPESGGLESLGLLLAKGELPTKTCNLVSSEGISYLLYRFDGVRSKSRVMLGAGLELVASESFIVAPPRSVSGGAEGRWKVGFHPADMVIAQLPKRLAALL